MKLFRYGVLVFFMSFLSGIKAQVNLDSLFGVWNDNSQADTNRLKAIHDIAFEGYLLSNPDSSFYYAKIQYKFARSINNIEWMSNALNTQGASFFYKGQLRKALDFFNKCLQLRIDLGG